MVKFETTVTTLAALGSTDHREVCRYPGGANPVLHSGPGEKWIFAQRTRRVSGSRVLSVGDGNAKLYSFREVSDVGLQRRRIVRPSISGRAVGREHEQSRFLRVIFFPRRSRHLYHTCVGRVSHIPVHFPIATNPRFFFYDRFVRFSCFSSPIPPLVFFLT